MKRIVVGCGFLFTSLSASAQTVLTFDSALARLRELSPAVVAARLRIEEARGRLIGASLRFPENPSLEAATGSRSGKTTTEEFEIAIEQPLDLPNRRTARVAAARAVIAQEEARSLLTERDISRDVASAFFGAFVAQERLALAMTSKQLAGETLQIAERRFATGDVAMLDVNVAKSAAARAEAELRVAAAAHERELSRIRVLLDYPASEVLRIDGSLREIAPIDASRLQNAVRDLPAVRLAEAELRETEADLQLAGALRLPEVGVRGEYSEEEGDRVALAGVNVSLPIFNRGQELSAIAAARRRRLEAERDSLVRAAEAEFRGLLTAYEQLRRAAAEYEQNVLPLLAENETLALESYEAGQIGLTELILVRRDALESRREFLDRVADARLAAIELQIISGTLK